MVANTPHLCYWAITVLDLETKTVAVDLGLECPPCLQEVMGSNPGRIKGMTLTLLATATCLTLSIKWIVQRKSEFSEIKRSFFTHSRVVCPVCPSHEAENRFCSLSTMK